MFNTLLIANRGEIACRIIRTCRRLGIKTIAVYSTADATAQHVQLADEAYWIGPAPSKESYLCMDKILGVAQQAGAQAIHPGYGFLSENAEFATACQQAGIIFVGPSASAITAMGSKSMAKRLMEKAHVPLIPGYHGDDQKEETLLAAAKKIGFPVLIKASAGGGGKGMRVVLVSEEFHDALESAKREALASFGNADMLIEKYVAKPRHIEIQLFADNHGNAVYLFERDCSIQRRHQKVIEEAPAPHISETLRQAMGAAAIQAAKTIQYTGAGTIEFLVNQNQKFYFMEMNTRLQVEHPVTEMITGLDLVEWQLLVAAGGTLPLRQEQLKRHGHAIEVRIYAEDPYQQFLPSIGHLDIVELPVTNAHVRIDSGVVEKDSISQYYDPMIAKLIVWDEDRESALRRLHRALLDYHILGVTTNIRYLLQIIQQPAFQTAHFSTHFIEEHESLLLQQSPPPTKAFVLAGLYLLLKEAQHAAEQGHATDPHSPWQRQDGWRMNLSYQRTLRFLHQHEVIALTIEFNADGYAMSCQDHDFTVSGHYLHHHEYLAIINGQQQTMTVLQQGHILHLITDDAYHLIYLQTLSIDDAEDQASEGSLVSPMPGTVVAIHVKPQQVVTRGTRLMVVEAMKMEHTLNAPSDGLVKEIFFGIGDTVMEGAELLAFEATAKSGEK
jgi:3-methylcrotonyl-CoA carboxylase alpha subunit